MGTSITSLESDAQSPPASAHYSLLRSRLLRLTPDSMKCRLYCRGAACKYCTSAGWSEEQMAVRGLYSAWITEDILAMSRPTEEAIEKFDIIGQFKRNNIRAIFNLQCPNEHAFCGPPLHRSGFSYDPEAFMQEQIYHYNFAMPDFGVCSVETVLDVATVMRFALDQGRVAVHCHAGLGRTGTLIACFLVRDRLMRARDALRIVRAQRPQSVQSAAQVATVGAVEGAVGRADRVLPARAGLRLADYVRAQHRFQRAEEARRFPHVPKLVFGVCERALRRVFGADGLRFAPRPHAVHDCCFGAIQVRWAGFYTPRGRAQHRYALNVLSRISTHPFERDEALVRRFQTAPVRDMERELDALDVRQLLQLLHAYMALPAKPLATRRHLIRYMEAFAWAEPACARPAAPAHKLWHCLVFFLCNVLSYLTAHNYDMATDLLTFWTLGDVPPDAKAAVHAHLRDLYARNLRQQEQQARALHQQQQQTQPDQQLQQHQQIQQDQQDQQLQQQQIARQDQQLQQHQQQHRQPHQEPTTVPAAPTAVPAGPASLARA